MQRPQLAWITAAGAALLTLVALVTPWWGARVRVSGSMTMPGGSGSMAMDQYDTVRAGPFNSGDLVSTGDAVMAGLLLLFALVAIIATVVLLFLDYRPPTPAPVPLATVAAGVGAILLFLAVLLVPLLWPGSGASFWDSSSTTMQGMTTQMSTYGHVGWYFGLAALFATVAAGVLALDLPLRKPAAAAKRTRSGGKGATARKKPAARTAPRRGGSAAKTTARNPAAKRTRSRS